MKRTALVLAVGEAVTLLASGSAAAQTTQPAASAPPVVEALPREQATRSGAVSPASSSVEQKAPPGPMGGYTWRSKPVSHRGHQHKQKVDPSRPQAKGPEFALAADGTSHISVQLSQAVEVSTSVHANTYTYDLSNAQVAVPNDRNPLVTTHFSTPVTRIKLVPRGKNARLILEMREATTPQAQVRQLPNGGAVLEISLSKPMGTTTANPAPRRRTSQHRTKPKG